MAVPPTNRDMQGVRRPQAQFEVAHEQYRQAEVSGLDVDADGGCRPPGIEFLEHRRRPVPRQQLHSYQPPDGGVDFHGREVTHDQRFCGRGKVATEGRF